MLEQRAWVCEQLGMIYDLMLSELELKYFAEETRDKCIEKTTDVFDSAVAGCLARKHAEEGQ